MKGLPRNIRLPTHIRFLGYIILILASTSKSSFSQTSITQPGTINSRYFNEELNVVTDRDTYISGEQVYIKLFCLNRLTHKPSIFSKVAYVSLLDHSANPVVQIKIWLNGSSGSGAFLIPDTLRTGNYFISSCTHWMQNFSPGLFSCKKISVINPFININHIETPSAAPDTASFYPVNNENEQVSIKGDVFNNTSPARFSVKTEKTAFLPREKIRIRIRTEDSEGNPVESDLAVTVVKSFAHDNAGQFITYYGQQHFKAGNELPDTEMLCLPEPEGHLISGAVYSTITGEPVAGEHMTLSLVGKTALCRFDKTDDNGVFNFIINETGRHELVIEPLRPDLKDYYIELNNPFPEVFKKPEPAPYFIDTAKLKEINDAIISMQVQELYKPFQLPGNYMVKQSVMPDFYGEPGYEVKLSDYIDLSSLIEVIKELIPVAFTETRKGKARFTLINSSPDELYLTNPFVLVDGVPVDDHDAVLKINPADIEKIKVLNSRYFITDIGLEGIIDIKTVKGNLSDIGIELPGFRQEFEAPSSGATFYSPEYGTITQKECRIPDFRNTLYWNPDIRTDKNGTATAEFYTSDEPGNYLIYVEGFTSEGQKGSSVMAISVSGN